jgi:subfamily B ATP-binding cassette protein MsbA
MGSFKRVFKYIWPQWHRLVVIVIMVMIISLLFAGSFATVVPLLKVMMGQEGLHGWIDRKVCKWRYGITFNIPDTYDGENEYKANYLIVKGVDEKDRKIYENNLAVNDTITGIVLKYSGDSTQITGRGNILKGLARAPDENIIEVYLKRLNAEVNSQDYSFDFSTGITPKKFQIILGIIKWVIDFIPKGQGPQGMKEAVFFIIILMGIITIIRCLARFCQEYLTNKVVRISIAKFREEAFAHTIEMPIGYFNRHGTSEVISRLIGDINSIGGGIAVILGKTLREPAKAITCISGAMIISWKLTMIFLCCAPFTFGCVIILGKKIKKYAKRTLASNAVMLKRLKGALSSLRVVKVYNQQDYEKEAYNKINRRLLKQVLVTEAVEAGTDPIMEVIGMFAGSAALLVGVHWISKGDMESASFFLLLIYLGVGAESIRKSSDLWNKLQKANAAAERVFAIIDKSEEEEKVDAMELHTLQNQIEFRNIFFTYPGCNEPTLRGLNLTVPAGHNIAIVGPNGSGKTTLVNLIPRFYDVDSGGIFIDGQDVRCVTLKSLRNQIAIVTQNVITFNDTIAANIAYSYRSATMDQIVDAAKRSFAHEFIETLPDGYNTVIGEDNSGLSGGQLQRIIIARAILKNPPILIFDEATSHIDADSEAKIHNALEEIIKDRTSFIIAHRFSTVISADTIAVMDKGMIIAQGTHEELIKDCELYQKLYENQLVEAT